MNTNSMFAAAKKMKLRPYQVIGHVLWALVSQYGNAPMQVGEIQKMVNLTSGIKPSAYQVKSALVQLQDMCAANHVSAGEGKVYNQTIWQAAHKAVAALACYSYVFTACDFEIYDAVIGCINETEKVSHRKLIDIKHHNQEHS